MTPDRARSWGGAACVAGGVLWALLGVASLLEKHGSLSYDAYNRLLLAPLLLFLAGFVALYRIVSPSGPAGLIGFPLAALGFALLVAGNAIEFWGVLIQSKPNARRANELGIDEHWIGSDIGWTLFGLGMLAVLIGGLLAALAIRRARLLPRWVPPFVALLAIGVLAGNLLASAPFFISIPAFASYGAGWVALGRALWGMGPARRSTFTGSRVEPGDRTTSVHSIDANRGTTREEERPM